METETKKDAFRRLAIKRTNAVIEKLRILGHCSNPWQYEYTDDDVKKIFTAIENELKLVKSKFKNTKMDKFTLQ